MSLVSFPSIRRKPIPALLPIISPTTAPMTACVTATFIPESSQERDAGNSR